MDSKANVIDGLKNGLCSPVNGYEDRYVVWTCGKITSIKRTLYCHGYYVETRKERDLKPVADGRGYYVVNLYDGSGAKPKSCKVHRLVAEAFLPNPENKRCVCHKDNDPKNNCVDNLYWGTDQENQDQAWADGLHKSEKPVVMIYPSGEYVKFKSQCEASRETGIPQQNISKCAHGKRKTAGGYKWLILD